MLSRRPIQFCCYSSYKALRLGFHNIIGIIHLALREHGNLALRVQMFCPINTSWEAGIHTVKCDLNVNL